MVALACSLPWTSGLWQQRWTYRTLQAQIVKEGIVTSIHYSTLYLILQAVDLQPHRTLYWKHPAAPDFEEKAASVNGGRKSRRVAGRLKNAALHKKSPKTSLRKVFVEGGEWSVRGYEGVVRDSRACVGKGGEQAESIGGDGSSLDDVGGRSLSHSQPPGYRMGESRPKPKFGAYLERIAQILKEDKELPNNSRGTTSDERADCRHDGIRPANPTF